MLSVGKTLKAHGIKGEIKVMSYMDSPDCFVGVKKIIINNTTYPVTRVRVSGNCVIIKLKGIDDMNTAETLRDYEVFAQREDLPPIPEDRYYITDIIGCSVTDGEVVYGKIKDVLNYGSADVIIAKKQGKTITFPWLESVENHIDVENKLFVVNKERFLEVVYED